MKGDVKLQGFSQFRRTRMVMWLLLTTIHMTAYFHRVSINVAADHLMKEFNLTASTLGQLAAVYAYMYILWQIPGGALVDRQGVRRISILTAALIGVGSIIFSTASGTIAIFAGRLLIGLGGAVVLVNVMKFQSAWFGSSEFTTISGFAMLVGGSGAIIAATPLAVLVEYAGWRTPFLLIGAFNILLSVVCWRVIRENPSEAGLEFPQTLTPLPEAGRSRSVSFYGPALQALANRALWPPFLTNFGVYGGLITFSGTWGVVYLMQVHNLSREASSAYMLFASIGYMLGSPIAGMLADRFGSRRKLLIAFTAAYCLFWLIIICGAGGGAFFLKLLYLLCFGLGFAAGGQVITFSYARMLSLPANTGSAIATVNLGVFTGLALLQPLTGWLLDLGWHGEINASGARLYPPEAFHLGFLACFFFGCLALASCFLIREQWSSERNINRHKPI
jgi:MFS family permease